VRQLLVEVRFRPLLLVLIDLIIGFLGLIIKDFGDQTESWA
jgi:hypothetical protein